MRTARSATVTLLAGVVAASMSMVGLAYAGVSLPDPAVKAFDRVGLRLPNQTGSAHDVNNSTRDAGSEGTPAVRPTALPSAASHGQEVSALARSGPGGCEFGQNVSTLASSKNQGRHAAGHRQDAAHRPDPCAASSSGGGPEGGEADTAGTPPNPKGFGKGHHPTGSSPGYGEDDHPGAAGEGSATNPTGYGRDSHPSDASSGRATNPTGNGKSSHPSGSASGKATNPTGNGPGSHSGRG